MVVAAAAAALALADVEDVADVADVDECDRCRADDDGADDFVRSCLVEGEGNPVLARIGGAGEGIDDFEVLMGVFGPEFDGRGSPLRRDKPEAGRPSGGDARCCVIVGDLLRVPSFSSAALRVLEAPAPLPLLPPDCIPMLLSRTGMTDPFPPRSKPLLLPFIRVPGALIVPEPPRLPPVLRGPGRTGAPFDVAAAGAVSDPFVAIFSLPLLISSRAAVSASFSSLLYSNEDFLEPAGWFSILRRLHALIVIPTCSPSSPSPSFLSNPSDSTD